jgi:hypothetical protein
MAEEAIPLVSIAQCPLQGGRSGQVHVLVVIAIDTNQVTVLDPLVGEHQRPQNDFQAIWAAMRLLIDLNAPASGGQVWYRLPVRRAIPALTLPLHPQGDRHTLDGVLFGICLRRWSACHEVEAERFRLDVVVTARKHPPPGLQTSLLAGSQ